MASERLTQIARNYLWRRKQHDLTLTRSQRKPYWQELAEASVQLFNFLGVSNLQMMWELQRRGWTLEKRENFREVLDELAEIATHARDAISSHGPVPQIPLARTIQRLCTFWEDVMGKAPTHNPKVLTKYVGKALSPAGCFITTFFAIVDPKILRTAISTEMAHAVKSRRARVKSKSSQAKSG